MGSVVEGFADEEESGTIRDGLEGPCGSEPEGGMGDRLPRPLGVLDQDHGKPGRCPMVQQAPGELGDAPRAHVDRHCAATLDEGQPFLAGGGKVVALQQGDPAGHAPVREGDAGRGRARLEGADAGDDLEGDAGGLEGQGFFPSAAEDQRVAPLEPHHAPALPGVGQQERVDVGLGGPAAATALPHRQGQGPVREEGRETRIQEGVEQHHLGLPQGAQPSEREQVRVARTGSDEADEAPWASFRNRPDHRFRRRAGG